MSKPYDDKQFSKDFVELTTHITKRLQKADSTTEVEEELSMLEGLATNPNAPAPAKTIYGIAYLMSGKEWYDFERGFEWVKKGAEDADEHNPFCWYILGALYLNGKPELPKDIISAKYWLDKSAKVGYTPANNLMELQWGNNPEGFLDWFEEKMEKRRPNWFVWVLIGVTLIILAILLFKQ